MHGKAREGAKATESYISQAIGLLRRRDARIHAVAVLLARMTRLTTVGVGTDMDTVLDLALCLTGGDCIDRTDRKSGADSGTVGHDTGVGLGLGLTDGLSIDDSDRRVERGLRGTRDSGIFIDNGTDDHAT